MADYTLKTDRQGVQDFRAIRAEHNAAEVGAGDTDGRGRRSAVMVEFRDDVENGTQQIDARQVRLTAGNWEFVRTIKVRNPSGFGFGASTDNPVRMIAWQVGGLGWCVSPMSDVYVELLEFLDEPDTGLEAEPPTARAAILQHDEDGVLVPTDRELILVNRGRGMFWEVGLRGYPKSLSGELHFFPIECDTGTSSSSSSGSSTGAPTEEMEAP